MSSFNELSRSTSGSPQMKRIRDSHPTRQQVHELFRTAVLTVCRVDSDLFSLGAHEQALTFRIGRNLANMIEHPNSKLRVDAEYNQQNKHPKIIRSTGLVGERPDLLIHVRGTNDSNLLAVEIKKDSSQVEKDRQKLQRMLEEPLRYRDAVLLILNDRPRWQWIGCDQELSEIPHDPTP